MDVLINNSLRNKNFCANLSSPKLKFVAQDFFVNIKGYGINEQWADEIIKTADLSANLITRGTSAENILKIITNGVKKANSKDLCLTKAMMTGVLRVNRENWLSKVADAFTSFTIDRYNSYASRLVSVRKKPLTAPAKVAMTRPDDVYPELIHGDPLYINNSLDYVIKQFQTLFPRFLKNDVKLENLDEINSTVAEIRWILAHATPWMRGSDAISNVFMRSIYKALGIKTHPLAKGVSLDLEAYCTELKDYKNKFATYFTKPPEIVN